MKARASRRLRKKRYLYTLLFRQQSREDFQTQSFVFCEGNPKQINELTRENKTNMRAK